MIGTYKVLSAVLSYPTQGLQAAAGDLIMALNDERLISAPHRVAVGALLKEIADVDLIDAQVRYGDLFDRTRSLSLHLFEHVHGESRDRGQAMVSLLERYRQAGMDVAGSELPDFIPLFVEFLSTRSEDDARAMLSEAAHILAVLAERLRSRGSSYAVVLDALVALSEQKPAANILESLREEKVEDSTDFATLDRIWEEAEVRFGPGETGDTCPRASGILRRMDAPVRASNLNPQPGAGP